MKFLLIILFFCISTQHLALYAKLSSPAPPSLPTARELRLKRKRVVAERANTDEESGDDEQLNRIATRRVSASALLESILSSEQRGPRMTRKRTCVMRDESENGEDVLLVSLCTDGTPKRCSKAKCVSASHKKSD